MPLTIQSRGSVRCASVTLAEISLNHTSAREQLERCESGTGRGGDPLSAWQSLAISTERMLIIIISAMRWTCHGEERDRH